MGQEIKQAMRVFWMSVFVGGYLVIMIEFACHRDEHCFRVETGNPCLESGRTTIDSSVCGQISGFVEGVEYRHVHSIPRKWAKKVYQLTSGTLHHMIYLIFIDVEVGTATLRAKPTTNPVCQEISSEKRIYRHAKGLYLWLGGNGCDWVPRWWDCLF